MFFSKSSLVAPIGNSALKYMLDGLLFYSIVILTADWISDFEWKQYRSLLTIKQLVVEHDMRILASSLNSTQKDRMQFNG